MLQTPAFKASGAIFCVTSFVSASPDKIEELIYKSLHNKMQWTIGLR